MHDSVGSLFTATNHLVDLPGVVAVGEPGHEGTEYLVIWAGDENVADTSGADIADTPLSVGAVKELRAAHRPARPGLPRRHRRRRGLAVLRSGRQHRDARPAAGERAALGGPDVPGPCTYTNGEVRVGNGFAGSPGSVVRLDEQGRALAEVPAALPTAEFPEDCHNLPTLPTATCANPHGIQVREDLDTMVTTTSRLRSRRGARSSTPPRPRYRSTRTSSRAAAATAVAGCRHRWTTGTSTTP